MQEAQIMRKSRKDLLRQNMFSGNPLDRLHELRADGASHAKLDQLISNLLLLNSNHNPTDSEEGEALILPFLNYSPLLNKRGHLSSSGQNSNKRRPLWKSAQSLKSLITADQKLDSLILLGKWGQKYYFALNLDRLAQLQEQQRSKEALLKEIVGEDGEFVGLRESAMFLEKEEDAAILAQARALLEWSDNHRFCGSCGSITVPKNGGVQRQCSHVAPSSQDDPTFDSDVKYCGRTIYPRTDPVAIMLVIHGDKCLLGRQAKWPPGTYSCLAGFIDAGESIEEAVKREVSEEVGVDLSIENVHYFSSQPWPFLGGQMMIGCHAYANSDQIRVNHSEIEDAQWFTVDQVKQGLANSMNITSPDFKLPPKVAIAHKLCLAWVEQHHRMQDSKL